MGNTSKNIIFDYINHDELIEDIKLKEDDESKLVIKSYQNMSNAWIISALIFGLFAITEFTIKTQLSNIFYIIVSIAVTVPIIIGAILGRKYRQYIKKNNIKILEDALYFYSK